MTLRIGRGVTITVTPRTLFSLPVHGQHTSIPVPKSSPRLNLASDPDPSWTAVDDVTLEIAWSRMSWWEATLRDVVNTSIHPRASESANNQTRRSRSFLTRTYVVDTTSLRTFCFYLDMAAWFDCPGGHAFRDWGRNPYPKI